jgi:hypothetical protein
MIVVPHGWNFMSGGISHSTPFAYTQDVPMLWYGPGFIQAQGAVGRAVTLADVAPTIAKLIGFDWDAPDGVPMTEALVPNPPSPPKLVVVLVYDAGGRYVHDLWPGAWPNLKGLIPKGTWYEDATAGASPSNTAPAHATIGTGAFPFRHGVLDNYNRYPDGSVRDPYAQGPNYGLLCRALAEDYAAEVGPDAIVGLSATVPWHLGTIGRGADGGGPATMAVLKESSGHHGPEAPRWGLPPSMAPFYRCPGYVNDLPPISDYWDVAETLGGGHVGSGMWRSHDIGRMQGGFDTPARIPYQQTLVEALIRNEGFGRHDAPDLLFVNCKLIDEVGHKFTASAVEMKDAVLVQDRALKRLVKFLDGPDGPGHGEWVLLVTADHGHTADPAVTGGFPIHEPAVHQLTQERFDHRVNDEAVVDLVRPIWLNLDAAEMKANGVTFDKIARYLAGLTKAQTAKPDLVLPPGQAGQRVFDAVFAGSVLSRLPCLPD